MSDPVLMYNYRQFEQDSDIQNVEAFTTGTLPDGSTGQEKIGGSGFKTTTPLLANITYSSGYLDLRGYSQVQTSVLSSTTGTINISFSMTADVSGEVRSLSIPYSTVDTYSFFAAPAFADYVKYDFVNSATIQTQFYFETKFFTRSINPQILGVQDFISPLMTSQLNRSVLVGKTMGDKYNNVAVSHDDQLSVSINHPVSAFGSVLTENMNPVIQGTFVYSINPNLFDTTTVASGTVTASNGSAVISSGASTNSSAQLFSKRYIHYRAGQGAACLFTTIFSNGVAGNTQLAGIGDENNGLFVGVNGTNGFGILRRRAGVDTWTYQANFNKDTLDGTGTTGINLDITKGNIFKIQFQYLGFGMIFFEVENGETGMIEPFHVIKYANANTETHLRDPSFPFCVMSENTTNNTAVEVKSGSVAGFIEGNINYLGSRYSLANTKTGVGSTETNILTIRNITTFNSLTNRVPVVLTSLSVGVDGTKSVIIRVTKDTTLGGTPSYTDNETNVSVIDYDTAGTTLTNGRRIFTFTLAKVEGKVIDLPPNESNLILFPGETLSISAEAVSGNTDVTASLSWLEDL